MTISRRKAIAGTAATLIATAGPARAEGNTAEIKRLIAAHDEAQTRYGDLAEIEERARYALDAVISSHARLAFETAKQEADAAQEATQRAFLAMLSCYPTSAEAARIKAEHLNGLSAIRDNVQEPHEITALIVGMAPPGTFPADAIERQRQADENLNAILRRAGI
ncbi:hypothetical protein [Oricola indica]|uniref:hypothetical protein n=1 Tax=Oricola indica TaxID=2872591 RepID=UPI003CCC08A1